MNPKPKSGIASHGSTLIVCTAAFATVIALSILWAVVVLFPSRGAPMERLPAAERACAHYAYQSERIACATQWLAESQVTSVANR